VSKEEDNDIFLKSPLAFGVFSAEKETTLESNPVGVLDGFENQELAKHCANILCNKL
jgi:hypothetical protein